MISGNSSAEKKTSWLVVVLYTLVIVGYPLAATITSYLAQNNQIVTITYRALVLALSLLLIFFRGRSVSKKSPYCKFLYIFWIIYFVRIVIDTWVYPVALHFGFKEYYISTVAMCLFPMISLMRPQMKQDLEKAFMFILVIGVGVCAIIWLLQLSSGSFTKGYNSWGGRLSLEVLNPITVGHLGVTIIIISIFSLTVKYTRYPKWVLLGALLVGIGTAIASASKGPLAALFLVILIFFSANPIRGLKFKLILVMLLSIVIMFQSSQYAEEQLGFSVSRLQLNQKDRSTSGRVLVMKNAWNQFVDNPIFGSSLEERETLFYPHNVLLESFMATGVIGGSIFLLLLTVSVIKSYKVIKYSIDNSLVAMLYFQYLVGALISGSLWGSSQMWILMGAVLGVSLKPISKIKSYKKSTITLS